jgi:hypothetical protein
MAGTPKLRVELSGLCYVRLAETGKYKGLHAFMLNHGMIHETHAGQQQQSQRMHSDSYRAKGEPRRNVVDPHKARLFVDPKYALDKSSEQSDDGYYKYPIGGDIQWPEAVTQQTPVDFPDGLLDVTQLTGLKIDPATLGINKHFTTILPLNFEQVIPPPSMINEFTLKSAGVNCQQKGNQILFLKLVFETSLAEPTFTLTIPDAGMGTALDIKLTAVANWIELRFKNDPMSMARGRDPVPSDPDGDPTHFLALYDKLLAGPGLGCKYYPALGNAPGPGMKIKSSLFTCMPGGGH